MASSITDSKFKDEPKDDKVDHEDTPDLNGLSGKPEFLNKEKTIIVFNDEITGHDVIQSLKPCIKAKFWAKKSRILILCGFHTTETGKMGGSFSTFHGTISKHLGDLKKKLGKEIEEMEYEFESVLLSTIPCGVVDGIIKYELDSFGESNLRTKFLSVLESEVPHVLVFGTCFSKRSEVNDHISASGLYPALFLSSDLGYVTDGKRFQLDDQQKEVIKTVAKVIKIIWLSIKFVFTLINFQFFL